MSFNQADLDRLGIDREKWRRHQVLIDAEYPLEVRVVGGAKVLSEALRAAGAEFTITHHAPQSWQDVRAGH